VVNVLPQPSASRKSSPARDADEGEARSAARSVHGRFRASSRLLRHSDFQRVYKQGRRHFGTHMTVFYLPRNIVGPAALGRSDGKVGPRIGFTVGRVLGGAVDRNRIKRRMREAVRDNLPALTTAVDVVINPKKSALTVEFEQLRGEVARAFAVIQEKCNSPAADQRG